MASKQSQRGQRVQREPPRWNEDSIRRFEEVQRRKREWIKCDEIAEWCSELDDSAVPNEAARENAYAMLRRDLINGRFGLHVRLVFPKASIRKRMTNKWFRNATEHSYDGERGDLWLKNCWLTRKMFQRWCGWHHLTKSPPRFEPQESHPVLASTTRDETAATKALASQLRINPKLKRAEAYSWCRKEGFNLSFRGFQYRVWPAAREKAGLDARAPPGRKRKSSRVTR